MLIGPVALKTGVGEHRQHIPGKIDLCGNHDPGEKDGES
jgi:hypothetical protein